MFEYRKDYIQNKCCSFELSIHQRILKTKNISRFPSVFNTDNNHMFLDHHIRLE